MHIFWLLVLILVRDAVSLPTITTNVSSTVPHVVNIGALFTLGSVIGNVAKIATDAALEDVNANPSLLSGTTLKINMHDLNYSGFLGIVQALRFMEEDTVAVIGPQSSVIAHAVLHIANELQVPFLSFAATDPTLSSLQYPYFVMTSQNDQFQMAAIADVIQYYGWTDTIAVYIDDDYGRNGIDALGDNLAKGRCKLSYKAALSVEANRDEITNLLVKVALSESRIIVLHTYVDTGLQVLDIARMLGMMGTGYVWIATNWLSTLIDIDSPLPTDTLNNMQGVLTLRMYAQDSKLKRNFTSRWKNLTSQYASASHLGINTYALYAYDTVWILAHAIDAFLNNGGNISFSNDTRLLKGSLNLGSMSIFNGGKILRENILQVNLTGITGPIQFNTDRCLINPAYEVLNVIGAGYRKIGYWSNYSGLSVVPPETLYTKPKNKSRSAHKLYDMIWPGQTSVKPRGWVFPNNGRQLIIGVPNRVSYRDFISKVEGTGMFKGYCFDVFTAAVNLLPYAVPYKLVPFGDGLHNPSCTELVRLITTGVYDAAIGDITIITSRTRMVDFTQPYIESGLVIVAPVRKVNSNALAFFRPFTAPMWAVTGLSFLVVGVVVWILEHRFNDQFRGPPKRQVVTILWFSFSTMFFAHKENTVSTLGRIVLLIWLFVVLIINSSYTASLTSILTVQQLSSPIDGIDNLIASNDPIGYQHGSFARDYLHEELGIHASRLVALDSPQDCAKALKDGPSKGGVAAIIDERAYIELFLSTRCDFTIVGNEFTKSGWGFAFPRDSPLAIDMSTAILKLSENGELQRIHDKWLMGSACSSQGKKLEIDRLELKSFWGLYVICGATCCLALLIYFMLILRQFCRHCPETEGPELQNGSSTRSTRLKTFLSFADEKEEEVKSRSKRRQMERGSCSNRSNGNDESINGSNSTRKDIEACSNRRANNLGEP